MTVQRPAAHRFDLDTIGAGLPVAAHREEIQAAARQGAMVVTAPPGTGKTTLVPPLVAEATAADALGTTTGDTRPRPTADSRQPGLTLVTQPRRIAVRAAARRIAALDGSSVGGPVGFTVRGERKVSDHTRIEMLTPGVLLRRLLADPELTGVSAVVLDEVHERSLDTDLLLGMLAEVRQLREDLLVAAMSATVDAQAVATLLGGAPVVEVPGILHPLAIDYAPAPTARLDARGVTGEFLDHVARTAAAAQRTAGADTDALVFLPGAREVDEVVARLQGLVDGVDVLPLHGRLPSRVQERATSGRRPGDRARIVVSTAVAESSLTVPGVHLVIDAGLSREVRRDRERDMTGLVTVSASQASAQQRAGRAARLGPGRAVRLYAESDWARMPAHSPAEITATDLTDAALLLACWGTPRGEGLSLLTPPPAREIAQAESTLQSLGLVDTEGRPTPTGQRVSRLPIGVREARALVDGARLRLGTGGEGSERTSSAPDPARFAAEVVAAISDDHRPTGADLPRLLRELRSGGGGGGGGQERTVGRGDGARRWRREADRLTRIAQEARGSSPTSNSSATSFPATSVDQADRVGAVLALGRPEWIARRVDATTRTGAQGGSGGGSRSYLLASGTRAALPEGSSLLGHEWLAVWEVQRAQGRAADGTGAVIRAAAPLSEAAALELGAALVAKERHARMESGAVRVREERRLGAIVLASTPVKARPEDTAPALLEHVREQGLAVLPWNPAATGLRNRLGLLHQELGEPWPAMDEATLLEGLEQWLAPHLPAAHGKLERIDLVSALRSLLPWPEATRLDELAPERLAVPSGSTARIDYPEPGAEQGRPVVAVKLQELFGLADTPRLAGGRVPVLFHLLSPARRPLAVTDDLRSFWDGPYREVRKEMRGRYPKHPWPEDPWRAQATARTTRAQQRRP
nr:ATP-dependent helicase HrpB [Brachybacterium muris]